MDAGPLEVGRPQGVTAAVRELGTIRSWIAAGQTTTSTLAVNTRDVLVTRDRCLGSYIVVPGVVALTAVLASYLPARRAAAVDPIEGLEIGVAARLRPGAAEAAFDLIRKLAEWS